MVRFLKFNRIQLLDNNFEREVLLAAPLVFCDAALLESLQGHGIQCSPLPPDGAPDGSVVVLYGGPLYDLVAVSDRLLGPGGCPWDQAQTHRSLKRYMLEETYEVFDAIDEGSDIKLREELGDVLLQPVMHAQMRKLAGSFDIDEVAATIVNKLVRRHPHVFGDAVVADADDVLRNWDSIKKREKVGESESILAGVPKAMPALLRAYEISKRAARAGFEWPDLEAVFKKLHEEETELMEAIESGDFAQIESEMGDLLFTAVNIARWLKVEPEEALGLMLNRFCQRFSAMEASTSKPLMELDSFEWDQLWESVKNAN